MIRDMGTVDRGVRALVVVALAILLALLLGAATVGGIILFVVAWIMLANAATGFCPTYAALGIIDGSQWSASRRPPLPPWPRLDRTESRLKRGEI